MWRTFKTSIMAGVCIGLGGLIFMKVGGIIGAVMFAFGLLCVLQFSMPLYTGTAGFINLKEYKDWFYMIFVLFGNIVGCFLLSLILPNEVNADSIIQSRIDTGFLQATLNGIGCGIIMTLIVQGGRDKLEWFKGSVMGGREKNLLLTLFGIPLFILCGFYHSIADAFYMFNANYNLLLEYLPTYGFIVLGNFIGCNIPRFLLK